MEEIVDNNRHRKGFDVENFRKSSRMRILQRERERMKKKKCKTEQLRVRERKQKVKKEQMKQKGCNRK